MDDVLTDNGSGLNYNRKKWNALIEESIQGEVSKIVIAHKDRFIRFGYDWFEKFLKRNGTEILVVKNEDLSPSRRVGARLNFHHPCVQLSDLRASEVQRKNSKG